VVVKIAGWGMIIAALASGFDRFEYTNRPVQIHKPPFSNDFEIWLGASLARILPQVEILTTRWSRLQVGA
jgi:hypothetical protein